MGNELYTGQTRASMRANRYELLHPHRKEASVTIGRSKKGGAYIYLSIELREELEMSSKPYCYIHYRGSKLMIAFTDEAKFPGYRKARKIIKIPGRLVAAYLPKGTKKSVSHHIEDGNIFVDLEELR